VGVVVVEYALPVFLVVRRLVPLALFFGIGLHAVFFAVLPLQTYSVTMILMYIVVVDPDAVHRVIDRMQGYPPRGEAGGKAGGV